MTGGVLMSKSSLLRIFILVFSGVFSFLPEGMAQDRIPACPPLGKTLKHIKPLREMNWANDTIPVQTSFPSAFRETGRNEIIDSIALLTPVFERLRQVRAGLSEDTVRILHIGDSHIRGHIYPQTTGTLLKETFGAVSYTDMGVNGATCLTFTHPGRIADIVALKPELLILSFGTNESHNRRYNVNLHYNQMDEFIKLLRDSLQYPHSPDHSSGFLRKFPAETAETDIRHQSPHSYSGRNDSSLRQRPPPARLGYVRCSRGQATCLHQLDGSETDASRSCTLFTRRIHPAGKFIIPGLYPSL